MQSDVLDTQEVFPRGERAGKGPGKDVFRLHVPDDAGGDSYGLAQLPEPSYEAAVLGASERHVRSFGFGVAAEIRVMPNKDQGL